MGSIVSLGSDIKRKEDTKMDAFREHYDALVKHIESTQEYLEKEAQELRQKLESLAAYLGININVAPDQQR